MIDMHAHWKPAEVADALRARTKEPRIVRDQDGVEVLKSRMSEEPLAKAFDDVDFHLGRMDRQGVDVSVLSLVGGFCWIDSQPLDVSGPLCRRVNDRLSAICQEHPGRFAAYAALPLTDISAAAAELERVLGLPGMIGAQLPGNSFLTRQEPKRCVRCWKPQTATTRFSSSTTALGQATPSPRSPATPTTRAAVSALDRQAPVVGEENIREVIAFPKTQSGGDPLTQAPSAIDATQLTELGLRLLPPSS